MTTETTPRTPAEEERAAYRAYTEHIERLCSRDPGARSALRSGLRRDVDHHRTRPMHKLVAPELPENADDATMQAYYTVASLIAAQPRHSFTDDTDSQQTQEAPMRGLPKEEKKAEPYGISLGTALGRAALTEVVRLSATESRITLLTRQSLRGIHLHLPATVHQLRSAEVEVDWARLLKDLAGWPRSTGRITRRWLQDYYRLTAALHQPE